MKRMPTEKNLQSQLEELVQRESTLFSEQMKIYTQKKENIAREKERILALISKPTVHIPCSGVSLTHLSESDIIINSSDTDDVMDMDTHFVSAPLSLQGRFVRVGAHKAKILGVNVWSHKNKIVCLMPDNFVAYINYDLIKKCLAD